MVDLRGERLPRISALCQSRRLIQLSSVLVRVLTVRSQRALRKSSYAQHRNLRIAVCAVVLISVSRSVRRQIDRSNAQRDEVGVRVHVLRRCGIGWSLHLVALNPSSLRDLAPPTWLPAIASALKLSAGSPACCPG